MDNWRTTVLLEEMGFKHEIAYEWSNKGSHLGQRFEYYCECSWQTSVYMDNIIEVECPNGEIGKGPRGVLCLEMDPSSEFRESFEFECLNGEIVPIKVENAWKPFSCSWCKSFGHVRTNFLLAPKEMGHWRQVPMRRNQPSRLEGRAMATKDEESIGG